MDEPVSVGDLDTLFAIFGEAGEREVGVTAEGLAAGLEAGYEGALARTSGYLEHPVFNQYHSETELMRYLNRLSDLLFVLARVANDRGRSDVLWQPGKTRASSGDGASG